MQFFSSEHAFLLERLLPQVLTATVCGFIVGYGREIKHRPAGIRTNILISVGCTIYASIGFHLATIYPSVDPSRIIGQIATGIGFLGAGAIVNQPDNVKQERYIGLTQQQILDYWQMLNDEANVLKRTLRTLIEMHSIRALKARKA